MIRLNWLHIICPVKHLTFSCFSNLKYPGYYADSSLRTLTAKTEQCSNDSLTKASFSIKAAANPEQEKKTSKIQDIAIGHVRYINILTWLRGFRVKIATFFKFLLSLNSQKRLGYKENNTKYRNLC